MPWLCVGLPLLAAAVVGCGARKVEVPNAGEDLTTHLGEKVDVSLSDWLTLPRADLARLADQWAATATKRQAAAREDRDSVALLPKLNPPVTAPVFQEAKYSPTAGFSLPPYLKEGEKDAAIALHLARFGDREAALKLADPADKQLLARIEAFRTEKNYPAEWTRLVGLAQAAAEFKLANGEKDGAAELVALHRQLRALLDEKAAGGPLGAALLVRGRRALQEAEAAWRSSAQRKTALADDVKAELDRWGDVPTAPAPLPLGSGEAEVCRVFHAKRAGRTVSSPTPADTGRALDLLALPLSSESVEAVVAFLDDRPALNELFVVYREKANLLFPEPASLAHLLIESGFTPAGGNASPGPGVQRETYSGHNLAVEVNLLGRSSGFGAIVRLSDPKASLPAVSLPRDFGAVHLDQSFEQSRLAVAPEQNKNTLTVVQKSALAKIAQPAPEAPEEALLQKETGYNLLASLSLHWSPGVNHQALSRLALTFWSAFGDARLEGKAGASGEYLSLTWEDPRTRFTLRLPYSDQEAPEFVAEDRRGTLAAAERAEAAAAFDKERRRARLAAARPHVRLARSIPLEAYPLQAVSLGMGRAKALVALPRRQKVRQLEIPDGVSLLFLDEIPATATHWPRQAFVRFGPDGRVAEIRVRYEDGLRPESKGSPSLLTRLKDRPNGAPEVLSAPWAALWNDLSPQKPAPVLYRWADDLTVLTCQRDAGGAEVVLRDCPPDFPQGFPLAPLTFVSRGPDRVALGQAKAEVFKAWNNFKPTTAPDGATAFPAAANSPYDAILVYFEGDRVSRILARHRIRAADLRIALQEAWSRDFDRLGMIRRQDEAGGSLKLAYGWHDDRTRVRIFAQEGEEGVRVFTEWVEWPVATKAAGTD
jgi:hypothetical protein